MAYWQHEGSDYTATTVSDATLGDKAIGKAECTESSSVGNVPL